MRATAVVVATLVLAACSVFVERGPVVSGWQFATPFPLAAGAVAVPLVTEPIPGVVPPNTELRACPGALIARFTVRHVPGDVVRPVHYLRADDGVDFLVIWPVGFSARRTDRIEIVAPDGKVFAREGERVEGLGGGYWAGGGVAEAAHVCLGEYVPTKLGG
jgi:hypothetical protein